MKNGKVNNIVNQNYVLKKINAKIISYLMNQMDFDLAVTQPWVVRNDVRIMALKILIWND